VLSEGGRVTGVVTQERKLAAEIVVVAGGAWASEVGATCGAPLPLTPMVRHLVILAPELAPTSDATLWDVELGAYFRPESGALLASPGDHVPGLAGVPPTDPAALALLAEKLEVLAPALASSRVKRSWACLRTFAPDKIGVIGADPRLVGLYWLAGLGGHGLTVGLAAGEVLARVVVGRHEPYADVLSPARLLSREAGPPPVSGKSPPLCPGGLKS
jgi:glycine/D-amino acid oxidase-like deaminating enzyme